MADILYILRSSVPKTIEIPPIRNFETLEKTVELFREYDLNRYFKVCNLPLNSLGIPSSNTSIPASYLKKKLGIYVINHLPYRTENRYTLLSKLIEYSIAKVDGILLISGDVKLSDISFEEAAQYIKSFQDGLLKFNNREIQVDRWRFALGAGLIPDRDGEISNLIRKVEAGTEFFQTQITFEIDRLKELLDMIENRLSDEISILVGVLPYKENVKTTLQGIFGRKYIQYLDMPPNEYLDHIEGNLKNILNHAEKLQHINLGIHVYPIRWSPETLEATVNLLDRI